MHYTFFWHVPCCTVLALCAVHARLTCRTFRRVNFNRVRDTGRGLICVLHARVRDIDVGETCVLHSRVRYIGVGRSSVFSSHDIGLWKHWLCVIRHSCVRKSACGHKKQHFCCKHGIYNKLDFNCDNAIVKIRQFKCTSTAVI